MEVSIQPATKRRFCQARQNSAGNVHPHWPLGQDVVADRSSGLPGISHNTSTSVLIFVARRVQRSHCSSIFLGCCQLAKLALSATQEDLRKRVSCNNNASRDSKPGAATSRGWQQSIRVRPRQPTFLTPLFRAPKPLPTLSPSNFVPKNGFPVVKVLQFRNNSKYIVPKNLGSVVADLFSTAKIMVLYFQVCCTQKMWVAVSKGFIS